MFFVQSTSTQRTLRVQYLPPLSLFEGPRILRTFKVEFNTRSPNPHVISFQLTIFVSRARLGQENTTYVWVEEFCVMAMCIKMVVMFNYCKKLRNHINLTTNTAKCINTKNGISQNVQLRMNYCYTV
jgi:hypothetical protein